MSLRALGFFLRTINADFRAWAGKPSTSEARTSLQNCGVGRRLMKRGVLPVVQSEALTAPPRL